MAPLFIKSKFTFKYTLPRHFSHHMNVLFLIPRHDRLKLRKGKSKRLVYKLFKTWRLKAIARVKKSSVKWKREKEIAHLFHNC